MTGRRLTPHAIADIVRAYVEDGENIRAIAAKVGRSYNAVHRHLKNAGVEFRRRGGNNRGRSLTPAERRLLRVEAASLRRDGHTIVAVAAAIGCSYHLTRVLLNEAGRPDPQQAVMRRRRERSAEATSRYLAGEGMKDIAAALGVSRSTVQRWLVDANVARRGWGAAALKDPASRKALSASAATLYGAGASVRDVAAAGGFSQDTARTLLAEAGVTLRHPGRRAGHRRQGPPA